MECYGAALDHEGECMKECNCPDYDFPVCGNNGKSYTSGCLASCDGTRVIRYGACDDFRNYHNENETYAYLLGN